MDKRTDLIYERIKQGKLSPEEAVEQLKALDTTRQEGTQTPRTAPLSLSPDSHPSAEAAGTIPSIEQAELLEKTSHYLKTLLSSVIKLPVHRIEADVPMEKYGIDSIMVVKLNDQLEKVFGSLSKTLFFEYRNIRELAGYFIEAHGAKLFPLIGIQGETQKTIKNPSLAGFPSGTGNAAGEMPNRFMAPRINVSRSLTPSGALDIAIIGLAGRYPQAGSVEEFWANLRDGRDCITEIPAERWDHRLYFDPDKNAPGKTYGKWGGFLDRVDRFDPLFFNISPREAEIMDPQERLFLETAWQAIEDSGYTRATLAARPGDGQPGDVGVFVGVMYEEYQLYAAQEQLRGHNIALSGNPASIANRVSYHFNFHGPSLALDTMCSSSLTALHLACLSLLQGGCQVAVAGGVNLSLHPNKYLMLAQGKFVSSKGQCESFGEGGDGYVPGEGVGALILKPLERAAADRDHIYGVVKGTAVNHGGKTNGYSVPNPNAQADVIGRALRQANVHPRTVSYLEAHGTGTALGDPIEITGLTKTFREYTADNAFCAIGSAKSNIGHCESAAGIAGLTKVLLQLRHAALVPSLHARVTNPNIDFARTPFVVQQDLTPWQRPVIRLNGIEKEYPRIAGVSSFGAGGSNAHVVIEEYIPAQSEPPTPASGPSLIILSAKTEDRLLALAQRLLDRIRELGSPSADLADIAFTLAVGREALEERLGFVAGSIAELATALEAFVAGAPDTSVALYRGRVKADQATLGLFASDEDMAKTIEAWAAKGKHGKLLDAWTKGLSFDWSKLYASAPRRRLSLPGYPFSGERYWAPRGNMEGSGSERGSIHPLVQENTSDLSEQRYRSVFSGREFFLADHVMAGSRIMPAAALLEMARAAVALASGEEPTATRLTNIVWARPLVLENGPVSVSVAVFPEDSGALGFEICREPENDTDEPEVLSAGNAALSTPGDWPKLDLTALQAECGAQVIDSAPFYDRLRDLGLSYGPAFQAVERIHVGDDKLLARLALPAAGAEQQERFELHPVLLDAALHSAVGLHWADRDFKPALPFALDELFFCGPGRPPRWAYVRSSAPRTAQANVPKLDIDLYDEEGSLRVRLKGLSGRALLRESAPSDKTQSPAPLLLTPSLREKAAAPNAAAVEYSQRLVLPCGFDDLSLDRSSATHWVELRSKEKNLDKRYESYAVTVLGEIQRILKNKPKGKVLIQIVIPDNEDAWIFRGLAAILKCARLENPQFIGQMIQTDSVTAVTDLTAILEENNRAPEDCDIRYIAGKRMIHTWRETETGQSLAAAPWKAGGVYLITGGAGGLGLIFTKEIADGISEIPDRTSDAVIVLTGRSPLSPSKQAQLKALAKPGVRIEYREVDVAREKDVAELGKTILENHGRLDGIIHSAGIIRDNYIIKKTDAELAGVFAPKVSGLVNLDRMSRDLALDFFICFSSMSGALGNAGQVDYSAANAFMDAFAGWRNTLVAAGNRHGRTLSINWPLWAEGGMHIDGETLKIMERNTGMIALPTRDGIEALYESLAAGTEQVMVAQGNRQRMRVFFSVEEPDKKPPLFSAPGEKIEMSPSIGQDELEEKTSHYLKTLLSSVIKLPVHRIDADVPMENYGIDSIMVMQLTDQLEKVFGSLSKTLFFEYRNICELAGYFIASHRDTLLKLPGFGATMLTTSAASARHPDKPIASRRRRRFGGDKAKSSGALDIAIIGLAGRYPQAGSVEEFWANLRDSRDCITEIPAERWDHRLYFDPDKNAPGKTYGKWGGFLDRVDRFDPLFFNISPREAEIMDPQERLFLETAWQAIEDSGYTRATLAARPGDGQPGDVGVFVGVMYEEYQLYAAQEQLRGHNIALSGNPASIANRVSYHFNFHGPSLALDTMCSSSLTALHLACLSLLQGGCQVAVAGGVNLSLHPNKYLMLAQGKFVSSKGQCESFGEGGDGYVPGEGVGALILKPLERAAADRDHIYGVVKGTAVNHGGKTNGYSVPNPNAQADVIGRALRQANVHPRTVSYLEAHGTGTALGDPIEITGLTKTFREYTADNAFCAIGSAKSNIGHCESAAGIAGLTKVLLQLRHAALVPSLHARVTNPNIDFARTPFVVQQDLTPWERPVIRLNGIEKEYPRIAGVSSFGAGGSNAHVVIEEYIPANPEPLTPASGPSLIILSAKTEDRLLALATQLLARIREHGYTDADLPDIAFTLAVGREALEERLGFVAGSIAELATALEAFVAGAPDASVQLYRGRLKADQAAFGLFASDEDMEKAIEAWAAKGKHGKLLDAWTKGLSFDWRTLYANDPRRRVSLPGYPFSGERYWAPRRNTNLSGSERATIHPLVHENTSDLSAQCYRSAFTGREFFLADHVMAGSRIMPAAAFLEMARAAVALASGEEPVATRLTNIVWARPLVLENGPVNVSIAVFPEDSGALGFEICREPENDTDEPEVLSAGNAALSTPGDWPKLDLAALQAECGAQVIDAAPFYDRLRDLGLSYGPAFQAVERIHVGDDKLLARLALPAAGAEQQERFELHPVLLDAALHSAVGLHWADRDFKPALPFALDELLFCGPGRPPRWAYVRSCAPQTAQANVPKLDIDLYDEEGSLRVRLKGLSGRALLRESAQTGKAQSPAPLLLTPALREKAGAATTNNPAAISPAALTEHCQRYLKNLLSVEIKLAAHKIETELPMEKYGIDSVMIMRLTDQLEKDFGSLPKTLFFEYPSIAELAGYFIGAHREKLIQLLGTGSAPRAPEITTAGEAEAHSQPIKPRPGTARRRNNRLAYGNKPAAGTMDIAIVGLAGVYPGAKNIEQFWLNLKAGKDCVTEVPADRWDMSLYFDADKTRPGKTCCRWGGFIDDVDKFDPLFFNIPPREADLIDPQERLFLQTVWNLFEGVGYTRAALQGRYQNRVGVYVGAMYQLYHQFSTNNTSLSPVALGSYHSIANRVSYFFNLRGPSLAIDTACSSSAYAIHIACESLRSGECALAVAGGVNLTLHPKKYLGLSQARMIGSHPGSRSFADGDGFLPAEGAGAVLLKPLARATADGDRVLAVIKSTAINHGGHANGFTAPNLNAQAELIENNFRKAGIDPRTVSYVEAAANGSALGDAIELEALTKSFRKFTADEQFCAVGSVKSNIGHAEAASGISQLTKVILQLRHRQIVPSIKTDPANPNLSFERTPFRLQRELSEWLRPRLSGDGLDREFPRRATISSFGAGGSNAHIIIEEYDEVPVGSGGTEAAAGSPGSVSPSQLMVFSAKNSDRLRAQAAQMLDYAQTAADLPIADMAATLQTGREAMEARLAVVVQSREELVRGLQAYLANGSHTGAQRDAIQVFSGNTDENGPSLKSLLTGTTGELLNAAFLKEKNLEKIALHWIAGGTIDWEALRPKRAGTPIALPTYPFEKRRCWVVEQSEPGTNTDVLPPSSSPVASSQPAETSPGKETAVILCDVLGISPAELNLEAPLDRYGFDSILLVSLLQQLQSRIDPTLSSSALALCRNTHDIIELVSGHRGTTARTVVSDRGSQRPITDQSGADPKTVYPELIHLNAVTEGRPVFWFHAAMGGVEIYQNIAEQCGRPFYGIQARGWMSDRPPLGSVEEMAAYYVEIIRSVDPVGPYDLAGYSLGGAIAYEVTRRLQALGLVVERIVMLDSIYIYLPDDTSDIDNAEMIWMDAVLRILNLMLLSQNQKAGRDPLDRLVHRDELDITSGREEFTTRAIRLAREHGLNKTERQLRNLILQNAKVQTSYGATKYQARPLSDPRGVTCHYFRNKGRSFYGPLEPFVKFETYTGDIDTLEYWKEWQNQIEDFRIIDIDSSSHMMLLAEIGTDGPVVDFCRQQYAADKPAPKAPEDRQPARHVQHITILAPGSEGDVRPFIALARGLEQAGFTVSLAAIDEYSESVSKHGVRFTPLGLSVADLKQLHLEGNGRKYGTPLAESSRGMENLRQSIARWLDRAVRACAGCDLLLYTGLAFHLGIHVAERLAVPSIPVYLQPLTANAAVPSFLMRGSKNESASRLATYAAAEKRIWKATGTAVNQWRTNNNLPPLTAEEVYALKHQSAGPVIYGLSPQVFKKPAEWGEAVFLTGFLFLDESETWRPSARLSEFIAAGPPPVYMGFGSMNAFADRHTLKKILTTVLETGARVLFSAGRDHIDLAHNLGVDARRVFNLGIAPHGWLFPRTKAIIHHGGAGTTAAALAAGVPSVIVPFLSDQFFWGNQMHALGAAPEPIPFRRLHPRRLADALRLATQDTIIRKNAAVIGRMLRSEDGVTRAVDVIRRLAAGGYAGQSKASAQAPHPRNRNAERR